MIVASQVKQTLACLINIESTPATYSIQEQKK